MPEKEFTMAGQKAPEPEKEKKQEKQPDSKAAARNDSTCREQVPLPEVTFSTFVFSLSTSVLMNLGELPDPVTKQTCTNLPIAKQTIDILGMMKEKTKNNLDMEEENLLTTLLYELRLKYVAAVKK